MRVQN